jgi:nucleoside-diphosphate-sugar epimerase
MAVAGTYPPSRLPDAMPPDVSLLPADLEDRPVLISAAMAAEPDSVFHLTGLSSEPEARQQPERAYATENGTPCKVYNLGAGQAVAIQEVLDPLIALSPASIRSVPSPACIRPVDVPLLIADTIRLCGATGWEPPIPLPQTLAELLDRGRERVESGTGC